MSRHQKVLIIILLAIISSFWFYALFSFGDVDFGENVTRVVRESEKREHQDSRKENLISIRQVNTRNAFTTRIKREAKEEKIVVDPAVAMTKSAQQIQFIPELGYFYGTPGSIDSYPMTAPPQFSPWPPMQQAYGNGFMPEFLAFQSNGQIACFLNVENAQNPYVPFYCTYIPPRPPPMTYQFPTIPGIPDFTTALRENENPTDFADTNLNPHEYLFQEFMRDCPVNHFRCDDGSKCVDKIKWCDNQIDCPDLSDEKKCSCRERLDRQRLCDNYLDCPNGEDELGCFGCPNMSFSCHDGVDKPSNCFTLKDRCDGNDTCTNAKDEEDCNVLTRTYSETKLGVFPAGYFRGFLQRNFKGRWYHVCGRANHWAWEACLTKLGHISKDPLQEMVILPNHRELGPFLLEDELRMVYECPKEILFVHCPDPSQAALTAHFKSKFNISNQDSSLAINASSSSDPILSIVGGRPSKAGAWPFIVAINKNGRFHCGGAVVSPYWILSAAHCFLSAQLNYYEIEAGMLRRHSFSPAHQIRRLKDVIIHQNFNPQHLSYDIALARLDEPLDFNEWIGPVTLPKPISFSGWNMEPSPGARCVALGWGALVEGGPDPDDLQEVEMPIVPCIHSRDRNVAAICAGYSQGGRDACQGDSGGPLMCRDSDFEWYIGGVVSHGIGCARVNEPGAYTKVSYFINWMNDVMNERAVLSTFLHPLDKCPGFSCHRPFHRCLPRKKRCDGIVDCLEAEDEGNCPPSFIQSATNLFKGLFGHK